jgi:cytochrome c peroxidase
MRQHTCVVLAIAALFPALGACSEDAAPARITAVPAPVRSVASRDGLDAELRAYLTTLGFTGRVGSTLEARLGRRIDHQVAEVGQMLWFDPIGGSTTTTRVADATRPRTASAIRSPSPLASTTRVDGLVAKDRAITFQSIPMVLNAAFFPSHMWNSRFRALSGDPFDNSAGLLFPDPEGLTLSYQRHLLVAQAFIPPTERVEVAGFTFPGGNDEIRNEVLRRLNATRNYRALFSRAFPDVKAGGPITFDHVGRAVAEFEFTLVFADAPIDRYARGDRNAMSGEEKRGALLFFGSAGCVGCHAVSGRSNEMFSDFREHVIGVPQVAELRQRDVRRPGAQRGLRARAGHREPGRSLRLSHVAA